MPAYPDTSLQVTLDCIAAPLAVAWCCPASPTRALVRAGTMASRSAPGGSRPSAMKSAASSPNSRLTMCSVARISPLQSPMHIIKFRQQQRFA